MLQQVHRRRKEGKPEGEAHRQSSLQCCPPDPHRRNLRTQRPQNALNISYPANSSCQIPKDLRCIHPAKGHRIMLSRLTSAAGAAAASARRRLPCCAPGLLYISALASRRRSLRPRRRGMPGKRRAAPCRTNRPATQQRQLAAAQAILAVEKRLPCRRY